MTITIPPRVHPLTTPGSGNGGVVPPWLQFPPIIVLPVEPGEDDVTLPVLPDEPTTTTRGRW